MSLKPCINEIWQKNTDYNYPEQAINQAESLKSLSSDLYTDNIRFIYELIQNADDAQATTILLTILNRQYLVVGHNGKPFDRKDFEGLCGINHGTKKKDLTKTGYKGLGFKSVFGKSNYVLICSKNEFVRFDSSFRIPWNDKWGTKDQQTWEKRNDRQFIYPWQITPISTDESEIDADVRSFLSNRKDKIQVAYVIRFGNIDDIDSALVQLKQQPHMFLFLRHIKQVHFLMKNFDKISIDFNENLKKISINKRIYSQWIIKRFEFDIPETEQKKLIEDMKAPEKLRSIQKTELFFAAKFNEQIEKLDEQDSILFSYLPTKIFEYKFPFLINANFLTNVNREQIHTDSIWNQWLFEKIPSQLFHWIKDLVRNQQFQSQAYRLIPKKLNLLNNLLANRFNQSIETIIHNFPFILNRRKQFLRIDQAVLDQTSMSKHSSFINLNAMREFIENIYSHEFHDDPFIDYDQNLEAIGVRKLTWKECIQMFQSDLFNRLHSIDDNKQMIKYFCEHFRSTDEIDIQQIPFLFDQKHRLQIIQNIYFPQETFDENTTELADESFVHPEICSWLNNKAQKTIKLWLQQSGVLERTDLTYLFKTIIPNAAHFTTKENAIPTIRVLFKLFQANTITKTDLDKLRKLKLLTTKYNLLSADRCFFSDKYKPRLAFEEFLNDKQDQFLSFDYVNENVDPTEWRQFFLAFGVQEELHPIVFQQRLTYHQAVQYGFREQFLIAKSPDTKHRVDAFAGLVIIPFIEHTENNYEFGKVFWSYAIKHIQPEILQANVRAYWGHPDKLGATKGSPLEDGDYIKWFVSQTKSIPTTIDKICESTKNIFVDNKLLKDLCGKYMYFPAISLGTQENSVWNQIFNLKTKLSMNDYFDLIEKIHQDGDCLKENLDRIQNIYSSMLKEIASWSIDEKKQAKNRVKSLYLLTENQQWKLADDLYFYTEGTNHCLNEAIPCLKLNYTNRNHQQLKLFLDLMNIKRIGFNDLQLADKQSAPAHSFRRKLIEILPFLKKWMKHLSVSLEIISSIDKIFQQDIDFIESDSLELSYQQKLVQKTNVYYDHKHKLLYVTRPWNSETVFINLPNKLCQLINILNFEDKLRFLLKGTIEEIKKHFQTNSIQIPTNQDIVILQPLSKVNRSDGNKSIPVNTNFQINPIVATPPPPPQPQIVIPMLPMQRFPLFRPPLPIPTVPRPSSEEIIHMELIDLSSITSSNSILSQNLSDITNESNINTGRIGEKMVYDYLLNKYSQSSTSFALKWLNEQRESYLPYDIIMTLDGKKQYIQVKSTQTRNQHLFPLSINEIEFILRERENYFIYRVYINEKEFIILDNIPWRLRQKEQLSCFLSIMPQNQTFSN